MKKNLAFIGFIILICMQLAVPVVMIVKSENVLMDGTAFKFKTKPVDPYDAFRGRYVALGFEADTFSVADAGAFSRGKKVFAIIEEDSIGFARISALTKSKPASGDYVRVKVEYKYGSQIKVLYPFDKFFMEESAAPKAENIYREHSRRGAQDAYVKVRIKNGNAVIENLYVNDTPIADVIKQQ
jgi:uncharacterized membrane-anchored protein